MVAKEKEVVQENTPVPYYTIVRYLSGSDQPDRNWFTPLTVADHIKNWIDLGYEMFSAIPTGPVRNEKGEIAAEGMSYTFKYVG